jgi:DNA-binding beta-propeller fold protein YncE
MNCLWRWVKCVISFAVLLIVAALVVMPLSAQSGIDFTPMTHPTLPWDAVPSPDGQIVYYTAIDSSGVPAVFSIPGAGGSPTELAMGAPLVMPLGLDVSSDGQTLYVADPWSAGASGNAIFAVPQMGRASPMLVNGTAGTEPQGVAIADENGSDQLYFSGINPQTGQGAVYKIVAAGAGDATIIAQGAPLITPSGVTVASDGTIYVLDRLGSGDGMGAVLRIKDGAVDKIASDVRMGGQYAGLALTLDETTLMVSSLDNIAGTAQVLVINLSTLQTSIVNDVIKENKGAGGLHRAHKANIFAWNGLSAGSGGGVVYRIGFNG